MRKICRSGTVRHSALAPPNLLVTLLGRLVHCWDAAGREVARRKTSAFPLRAGRRAFHNRSLGLALGLLVGLSLLAACGPAELRPVELVPEDMCAHCRMAVSEKRYAAQLITEDGEALKFDDLVCLANHLRGRGDQGAVAGRFAVDFDSREWVKAEEAYYVRAAAFKTPMGGGVVAFKERAKAEAAAAAHQGRLLRFAELGGG